MMSKKVIPLSAASAMLAGIAWAMAALLHGSQPAGCVGENCAMSSMRGASEATVVLVLVAGSALLVSCTGLVFVHRQHASVSRLVTAGLALTGVGIADLALAATLQELVFGADFELMPALVVPGAAALVLGLALTSWTALRARVVPRWVGSASLSSVMLLLLVNEQTDRIYFAVPFGLAWTAVGVALVRSAVPSTDSDQPLTARAAEGV